MEKITFCSNRSTNKIKVPTSLFHFQNSPATKLINVTGDQSKNNSKSGSNDSMKGSCHRSEKIIISKYDSAAKK